MSTTPQQAYLLSFDNGQSWEDHYRCPLFFVPTRERADQIVQEVNAWVNTERPLVPEDPLNIPGLSDEEYLALHEVRQAHIASRQPPYGINAMRDALDTGVPGCGCHLVVTELKYLQEQS